MKDTLRDDIRKLIGTSRDDSNYLTMAYKTLNFNISLDDKRSYDISLEGEVEIINFKGESVVTPEAYGTYLDKGRTSELHIEKNALLHVRESGKGSYPVEVFTSLADVFLWVKS